MSVRRGAVRLATVCTLLAGLVAAGAAPALADDDSVKLGAPDSFTAGGSAGSISVGVTKGSEDCVSVRTTLAIRLPGLTANQVNLQVAANGDWQPLAVSDAGGGLVTSGRVAPEKPRLCERKSVSVRYRLSFVAGTPGGSATIVAEAYTADGDLIERDAETLRVNGARGATPTPTRSSTSPTPNPSAEVTVAPEAEPSDAAVVAVPTSQPGLGAGNGNGNGSGGGGIGSMVMVVGVAMVAIGIALLVLLLRRTRGGPAEPAAAGGGPGAGPFPPFPPRPGAGGDATVILPRVRP
jgi:hypothetical protein